MPFDLTSGSALAGSAATGVLFHVLGYRLGEWDLFVPHIVFTYGLATACFAGTLLYTKPTDDATTDLATILSVLAFVGAHVCGVFSSITVYRLFFHRLRNFPGPFLGRLSNFYPTYLRSKKLHLYEEVEQLHQKYGDIFRLGPNELSIIDPRAVQAIYSAKSPCTKGPFYNVLHPRTPLNMIRDHAEHASRRRVWDRGFSTQALRAYEPRVENYTSQLLSRIAETEGTVINAADWFNFYSFDVMGDLAFGKSFNMLRDGVKHYFMKCLHADMTINGFLAHITWLFPLIKVTPILNSEHLKFWSWCEQQVQERIKNKPETPDIFTWLLEEYDRNPKTKKAKLDLDGEAYLIAVAGSDTTAATLTNVFFELATHRPQFDELQKEVDEYFSQTKTVDSVSLSKLPYLNAVIDEGLRLHPPVPSGLQRVTPKSGLLIGETFIPGNTVVQVPLHTIQRDARSFEKPEDFIPERWTTKPHLVKNSGVLEPFSIGRYSCVGKRLGLMELRYVISQIVYQYDVKFAPGQTRQGFLDSKRDTFTLAVPKLDLIFSRRET